MPRNRSQIPLLTDWDPGRRQKRTHRRLDTTRENIALLALSPVGDGLAPRLVAATGDFGALADQEFSLLGENFLQESVQATATTDDGGVAEMLWTILYPGSGGNDYSVALVDIPASGAFAFTWTSHALVINYDSTNALFDGSDDLATVFD